MTIEQKISHINECTRGLAFNSLHSRIHPLKTFGHAQATCFVKREDELGFGISGSKIRKYSSLIPHFLTNKIEEAILIGGAYSNNIVGLVQMLIENSIQPTLFLHGCEPAQKVGNFLLTSLMVPTESIHWVSRDDWSNVDRIAMQYAQQQSTRTMVVPEGASVAESLPGALTLALDIIENETQLDISFDHIFIDSGTGVMACTSLLVFAHLQKSVRFHVVLMAETETVFLETLLKIKTQFSSLTGADVEWDCLIQNLRLYHPSVGRSFGSTNATIFDEICHLARVEGFLTDPIYSAKLFLESRRILDSQSITGNCLLIHSGGGLTLMGFQEHLVRSADGRELRGR